MRCAALGLLVQCAAFAPRTLTRRANVMRAGATIDVEQVAAKSSVRSKTCDSEVCPTCRSRMILCGRAHMALVNVRVVAHGCCIPSETEGDARPRGGTRLSVVCASKPRLSEGKLRL